MADVVAYFVNNLDHNLAEIQAVVLEICSKIHYNSSRKAGRSFSFDIRLHLAPVTALVSSRNFIREAVLVNTK